MHTSTLAALNFKTFSIACEDFEKRSSGFRRRVSPNILNGPDVALYHLFLEIDTKFQN